MSSSNDIETFSFSADINQLLSLIINTFYSNKDIVIRELISNSSDALNKIRYESLTNPDVLKEEEKLHINISFDKNEKVLIISDTGIGMTKNDLINNLGTIAKSGTKSFIEQLKNNNGDINMIGQFGVGFYSAYLIANKVTVISKHNDDNTYCWTSEAGGSFNVFPITDSSMNRGTSIHLHLKEDMYSYLESDQIKQIIKKYSQYVEFPIYVETEKTKTVEVEDNEEVEDVKDDEVKVEEVVNEEDGEKKEEKKKTIEEKYKEFDLVNDDKPIWTKNPDDITSEEYTKFYKSLENQYDEHLEVLHFHVEGNVEYRAILYVPKRAPFDMFENKKKCSVKLYVRRIFITDSCEELIPDYLKFVSGIVDSDDMPLNISREMLQQNKILKIISKNLVKKCIDLFKKISEDEEKYKVFYNNFSKNIKLGIHEDSVNRNKLASLLRFETNTSNDKPISFDEYIDNMKENQKGIYYITGESKNAIKDAPFIERLEKLGYNVFYMTDPIDEYMVQQLKEYNGKKLINITKDKLEIDEIDKDEFDKQKEQYKELCTFIKDTIGSENIENVNVSNRLDKSPCILVTNEWGMSANMQRIMKAQALRNNNDVSFMMGKKIMEINPSNRIIQSLNNKYKENKISKDVIWLLYEVALINSGFSLDNNKSFADRIHKLISFGLNIDEEFENEEFENNEEETTNENVSSEEKNNEEEDEMEKVD